MVLELPNRHQFHFLIRSVRLKIRPYRSSLGYSESPSYAYTETAIRATKYRNGGVDVFSSFFRMWSTWCLLGAGKTTKDADEFVLSNPPRVAPWISKPENDRGQHFANSSHINAFALIKLLSQRSRGYFSPQNKANLDDESRMC